GEQRDRIRTRTRERPLQLRSPVSRLLVDEPLEPALRGGDVRLGVRCAGKRPRDDEGRTARERAAGDPGGREREVARMALLERERHPAADCTSEDEEAQQDE